MEVLPRFQGGIVAEFQALRQHQRDSAKRFAEESRLPDGVSHEPFELTCVEVIPLYQAPALSRALKLFFGTEPQTGGFSSWRDFVEAADTTMTRRFDTIVGVVGRPETVHLGMLDLSVAPRLFSNFEHVVVKLERMTSVHFALTLRARFNDHAKKAFRVIREKRHLGRTVLTWQPFRFRMHWIWCEEFPENSFERHLEDWRSTQRRSLESVFRPVLSPGVFLSSGRPVPSLYTYLLHDLSVEGAPTEQWLRENRAWLATTGLPQAAPWDMFAHNGVLLSWRLGIRPEKEEPSLLVLCKDFLKGRESDRLSYHLHFISDPAASALALLSLQQALGARLDTLTSSVLRLRARRRGTGTRGRSLARENLELRADTVVYRRLSSDLKHSSFWLRKLSGLALVRVNGREINGSALLAENLVDSVKRAIAEQYRDIRSLLAEHEGFLQLEHISLMATLEKSILLLTAVLLILTITVQWEELEPLVDAVLRWLSRVLG